MGGSCAAGGVTAVLNPTPATAPQRAAASAAAARAAGTASTSGPAQPSSATPVANLPAATPAGKHLENALYLCGAAVCN